MNANNYFGDFDQNRDLLMSRSDTLSDFINKNIDYIKISKPSYYWDEYIKVISTQFNVTDDIREKLIIYFHIYELYYIHKNAVIDRHDPVLKFEKNIKNLVIEEALKVLLDKLPDKRSTIVGKVYNYLTKSMEYQLEDGNFVPIKEDITPIKYTIEEKSFPIEFIKQVNLQLYRKITINEIL